MDLTLNNNLYNIDNMANRAQFIQYKGREIYFIDYSNIKTTKDALGAIKETNAFRKKVAACGKKNLLMLVDVTGSFVVGEVIAELKRSGIETKPLVDKTAVVGITGSRKILLDAINTVTGLGGKPFDNLEEAKEWLVK